MYVGSIAKSVVMLQAHTQTCFFRFYDHISKRRTGSLSAQQGSNTSAGGGYRYKCFNIKNCVVAANVGLAHAHEDRQARGGLPRTSDPFVADPGWSRMIDVSAGVVTRATQQASTQENLNPHNSQSRKRQELICSLEV